MKEYWINNNKGDKNENEFHKEGCSWLEKIKSKTSLGHCADCYEAKRKAKEKGYSKPDGCEHCCPTCHTV